MKKKIKNIIFLDTNILINLKDKNDDERIKKLNLRKNKIFITEIVNIEINNLLKNKNYKKLININPTIIYFEDIRKFHPEFCSLYYNGISYMNNPAIINGDTFLKEMLFTLSSIEKQTTEYKKTSNIVSDFLIKHYSLKEKEFNSKTQNNPDRIFEILKEENFPRDTAPSTAKSPKLNSPVPLAP